jgi:hypothetical protein
MENFADPDPAKYAGSDPRVCGKVSSRIKKERNLGLTRKKNCRKMCKVIYFYIQEMSLVTVNAFLYQEIFEQC